MGLLLLIGGWLLATGFPQRDTRTSQNVIDGDIRGLVTDERGVALDAAQVLAVVKTWPPGGFEQKSFVATTRRNGRFELENVYPTDREYEIQIAVIADGRLMNSRYISDGSGPLEPQRFQLDSSAPFAVRFESEGGHPIPGVSVFPFERVDRGGQLHCVYFCSAEPITRKSDASGDVAVPHFAPGERATLYVQFPNSEWQTREFVVPSEDGVVVLRPQSSGSADSVSTDI